ncbi:MAG: endonuclease/exonuclease/phosphatase family metal-dependent hydrolase [Candidatus Binatia bacterium]|jgi:endonuclease/exonuclease/phosphatase family metal-dependent hydrolase
MQISFRFKQRMPSFVGLEAASMKEHYIAWWNVENLFSVADDPDRPEWLAKSLKSELKGWTKTVLAKKVAQLAKVVLQMNNGAGPDILGVCEVENKAALELLVDALKPLSKRRYRIAHHDTKDKRGIDVAFIYDFRKFKTKKSQQFDRVILKRNSTRDLFQVNFTTKPGGRRLILIGNHWPSRLGGELASEPYRILAGETLSYWLERIGEVYAEDAHEPAVLAMGDFNDEPQNRSLADYALGERIPRRVVSRRSRKPYLLNLMWPLMGRGEGTHFYGGEPGMLDQFLINRGLLAADAPLRVDPRSVKILQPAGMKGSRGPKRFGRPSKKSQYNPEGFSDHYPISVIVTEVA